MKHKYNDHLLWSGYLNVSDGHQIYIEEWGKQDGLPVVFLHGGPGGMITPNFYIFFDPSIYRVIAFDQRGTGRSLPFLSLVNNTVDASIEDIHRIKEFFNIEKWIVFGGSYGSTLALAYAIKYPEEVLHLVLRGVFLGRPEDIHWLFEGGLKEIFPEEFQRFKNTVNRKDSQSLVEAFYHQMILGTWSKRFQACDAWARWESGLTTIVSKFDDTPLSKAGISLAILEAHYFKHQMFWNEENYLLNRIDHIGHVPMEIVHGRLDLDCRVVGAYDLKAAYPDAHLHIIEGGGHSPYENPIRQKLINIMSHLGELYY